MSALPDDWPLPVLLSLATLFASLAVSVVTDLRRGLIYNWVTLPALLVQLAIRLHGGGWSALGDGLLGALVCAGPLLIPLPGLRGRKQTGMGDVKLMAATGAAFGLLMGFYCFLYVSVAGGLQAVAQVGWAKLRGRPAPKGVPYGVAVLLGTSALVLLGPP